MEHGHQSRISGAIALSIAQAVVLLLGYVTHLLVGRLLGPAPYGIYGIVLSLQTIFGLFLTLGVPSAVSRFVARDTKHAHSILQQALKIQAVIALSGAILILIIAPVIARMLNDTNLTLYVMFISVVLFFQAFYPVFVQFLSGLHRFNKQAALTSLYAVAKLAGALTLLFVFGVYGALAGFAIGGIIAAIAGWVWTRPHDGTGKQPLPMKSFLSFAGTYVLILVGLQILMSIDLFMVKSFMHDNVQAGFYNAAVTLSRIPYFLLQGLMFVLLPSVSALTKPGSSRHEASTFIRDTVRYLIAIIVPCITLASATSENLVILFFSNNFIQAAPVLTVLMLGLGALSFYLLVANIVAGAGKARVGLYITATLVIISGLLGSFLIPRYGLMGAAWQTTITSFVGLILLGTYTCTSFRIPFPIISTINVIVATAITVLPTYIWKVPPYLLPVQYIILLTFYIFILLILKEIKDEDRIRVSRIHRSLHWVAPR